MTTSIVSKTDRKFDRNIHRFLLWGYTATFVWMELKVIKNDFQNKAFCLSFTSRQQHCGFFLTSSPYFSILAHFWLSFDWKWSIWFTLMLSHFCLSLDSFLTQFSQLLFNFCSVFTWVLWLGNNVVVSSWLVVHIFLFHILLSFDSILAQFWLNFGSALTQFWLSFCSDKAQFWLNLGSILAQFLLNLVVLSPFWPSYVSVLSYFWHNFISFDWALSLLLFAQFLLEFYE